MKNLFGFLCLFFWSLLPCNAEIRYKEWDINADAFKCTVEKYIPSVMRPETKVVWVETITIREATAAFKYLYPDYKDDMNDVLGFYLPHSDADNPYLPKKGSQIFITNHSALNSPAKLREVILHEYGHFVYFELMTRKEQRDWFKLWKLNRKKEDLPTEYSYSNESEAFSEAFWMWALDDPNLSNEMFDFVKKVKVRLEDDKNKDSAYN